MSSQHGNPAETDISCRVIANTSSHVPASRNRNKCSGHVRSIVSIVTTIILAGCNAATGDRVQVFPVDGQITLDGKPLANAFVTLHPRHDSNEGIVSARGVTDQQGNFQLSTYDARDGASAGEYAVTIHHHKLIRSGDGFAPGPNDLSPRIAVPTTTDIIVRVAAGTNHLAPIEVRRK